MILFTFLNKSTDDYLLKECQKLLNLSIVKYFNLIFYFALGKKSCSEKVKWFCFHLVQTPIAPEAIKFDPQSSFTRISQGIPGTESSQ